MKSDRDLDMLRRSRDGMATGRYSEIRRRYGMTHADVAERIGVGPSAISHYERGRRHPRGEIALRYARLMESLARRLPEDDCEAL